MKAQESRLKTDLKKNVCTVYSRLSSKKTVQYINIHLLNFKFEMYTNIYFIVPPFLFIVSDSQQARERKKKRERLG